MTRAGTAPLLAALVALAGMAGPAHGAPALARLDHVPVAVRDLDAAVADYRALGFAIKPGRPHANGLRNAHVKFRNGAGLELITAAAAGDELSTHYAALLAQGEGPAFLTLHAPDEATAAAALQAAGIAHRREATGIELTDPALRWVFFTRDNRSPSDRPEHFAHANGACATREVWVAPDDAAPLARLLSALGARAVDETRTVPWPVAAQVFDLADAGRVVVVPARHQRLAGRPVIGVTLAACEGAARWWPPGQAHGLWLGLLP